MAKVVHKFILQALCNNQGSLDFGSLDEQLSKHFTVDAEILRSILSDEDKISIREGKEKTSDAQVSSPDSVIVAKTSVRLCQSKTCEGCDHLHLCRYYVCGGCTFKDRCKNSHNLSSPHNVKILEKCDLQHLTEEQLFQLLLQNDPFLLPEICAHYNKGSCKYNATCTKLHMCQHFLKGDCTFGETCKRAHAINDQGMKLFKQYSQENIKGLYMIYRNKLIIQDPRARPVPVSPGVTRPVPVVPSPSKNIPPSSKQTTKPQSRAPPKVLSDSDRNEICLYFLRKNCTYKDRCVRIHWHLPYKWEIWEGETMTWKSMDNMEEIEKAYCNPSNNTSCSDEPTPPSGILRFLSFQSSAPATESVDFIKMIYRSSPIRRLSTASSVSHPPNHILTTQWLWYWKDDNGAWVEYGQDDTGNTQATVTSQTLENVYLADQNDIEFTAGSQKYKLSFKGTPGPQIYQQNLKYNTTREVRRRPRFVSAQDVEIMLKSGSSSPSQSSAGSPAPDAVPSNWDKNSLPEIGYKLVPLSTSASEYRMIVKLFMSTMPQSRITSIKRIQNPSLWRVFQWQREQMQKRNAGKTVNEKHLFHGTDKSLVEAICEQNFDWRMCGVHGTAYGKGSYFARDASYSNSYSIGTRDKVMFVALVLVGDYTKGQGQYVRPPKKGTSMTLYDSCVNNRTDPSIFVIFEKHQIYPEYIIEYN